VLSISLVLVMQTSDVQTQGSVVLVAHNLYSKFL